MLEEFQISVAFVFYLHDFPFDGGPFSPKMVLYLHGSFNMFSID